MIFTTFMFKPAAARSSAAIDLVSLNIYEHLINRGLGFIVLAASMGRAQ